jgi:hypothetical protein
METASAKMKSTSAESKYTHVARRATEDPFEAIRPEVCGRTHRHTVTDEDAKATTLTLAKHTGERSHPKQSTIILRSKKK